MSRTLRLWQPWVDTSPVRSDAAGAIEKTPRDGIQADAIHGDKSQLERIKALEAFKAGQTHALIATDVAARGLDVDDLPYVINYELPHTPEDYVHRIGRTGRAGKTSKLNRG